MRVIKNIEEIEKLKLENTIVALGKFDGIHKGHYKIMNKLKEEKTNGLTSLVFTFSRNPSAGAEDKKIFTEDEQIFMYEKLGTDIVIICPIESGILQMEAGQFIEEILIAKFGVKKIVCGENFRFGKNRMGDTKMLKEIGKEKCIEVKEITLLEEENEIISSTKIRKLISEGEIKRANMLLGHPYTITGKVIHGNKIGRTINTPTANIEPHENKILPPFGVYKSNVEIDGKIYKGVTNIGKKPTIKNGRNVVGVETYLFDFEMDIYGRTIQVEILDFVRKERKFDGIDKLMQQLEKDKLLCKNT